MKGGKLGVFDSGLGGLTVVKQIKKASPETAIVYLGDTARLPYGSRSKNRILEFCREDARFLIDRGVSEIVIACNTASALAGEELKSELPVPVSGVIEPAVVKALELTKSGKVGLLATRGTINSRAYEKVLAKKEAKASLVSVACPLLVPLVEEGIVEGEVVRKITADYCRVFKDNPVDVVILGCTHYPMLAGVIAEAIQRPLVDCGEALAEQKQFEDTTESGDEYYVTDLTDQFVQMASRFLGVKMDGKIAPVQI